MRKTPAVKVIRPSVILCNRRTRNLRCRIGHVKRVIKNFCSTTLATISPKSYLFHFFRTSSPATDATDIWDADSVVRYGKNIRQRVARDGLFEYQMLQRVIWLITG